MATANVIKYFRPVLKAVVDTNSTTADNTYYKLPDPYKSAYDPDKGPLTAEDLNDEDWGEVYYLSPEQRFVEPMRNTELHNFEEQYLLGISKITKEWTDASGDFDVAEIFYYARDLDEAPAEYFWEHIKKSNGKTELDPDSKYFYFDDDTATLETINSSIYGKMYFSSTDDSVVIDDTLGAYEDTDEKLTLKARYESYTKEIHTLYFHDKNGNDNIVVRKKIQEQSQTDGSVIHRTFYYTEEDS